MFDRLSATVTNQSHLPINHQTNTNFRFCPYGLLSIILIATVRHPELIPTPTAALRPEVPKWHMPIHHYHLA